MVRYGPHGVRVAPRPTGRTELYLGMGTIMAVESNAGGIMITGEHVHMHQHVVTAHALALELNTTMRASRRGSVMLAANRITSTLDADAVNAAIAGLTRYRVPADLGTHRTKRGALADLVTFLMITWGWEPLPSVRKALGKDADKIVRRAESIRLAVLAVEGGK